MCYIGGVPLSMVIDSGSHFNIFDKANWNKMKQQNVKVSQMNRIVDKTFKAYGDHALEMVGSFEA